MKIEVVYGVPWDIFCVSVNCIKAVMIYHSLLLTRSFKKTQVFQSSLTHYRTYCNGGLYTSMVLSHLGLLKNDTGTTGCHTWTSQCSSGPSVITEGHLNDLQQCGNITHHRTVDVCFLCLTVWKQVMVICSLLKYYIQPFRTVWQRILSGTASREHSCTNTIVLLLRTDIVFHMHT